MRSSIAYAALAVGLGGLVWFVPAQVRACSCTPPPPPREAAELADAVFQGTVTGLRVEQPDQSEDRFLGFHVYTLEVERRWKGEAKPTLTIRTADNSAACGRDFAVGQSYLVYAREIDGVLSDNLCSRTRPAAQAEEDFAALGPAVGEPDPPPRAEPDPAPPAPSLQTRGCAVAATSFADAGLGFVGLALWLGSRRRKRRPGV